MPFDKQQKQILRTLQLQGKISNVELSSIVGMSESPCFRRVRSLEENGTIVDYRARLNRKKLGLEVVAFVNVSLEKCNDEIRQNFHAHVEAEEHIVECHAMSGSQDYLLKVIARNIDHFSDLCMQKILKYPGVQDIESNFSLKEIKESGVLPLD